MSALTPAAYLAEQIADEKTLARLLGWTVKPAISITPGMWLQGYRGAQSGMGPPSYSSLPQWRRSWAGAGELIGRCELSISNGPGGAWVATPHKDLGGMSLYKDYPTKDDAIRAAICKAAIAYLTAEAAK